MSDVPQPDLPAMGFVENLDDQERAALGGFGEFITAGEGDVVIAEGAEQNSLYLVVFGRLHVQTETTGRSVLLGTIKSGDTIGEVNIFDPGKASASVVAKALSQIWKIDRNRLADFIKAHPDPASRVLYNIATVLSRRLRRTNEKVAMAREAAIDTY